jgi:hypothetical protein
LEYLDTAGGCIDFTNGLNVLTMPLATAVERAIYFDLRFRLEGADLGARFAALSPC